MAGTVATRIGDRLPPDVARLFAGDDLAEQVGIAYPLVTVDEPGTPRLSMLSAGELLTVGDQAIRIAMWPRTNTGVNLAAGRPALLCVVRPGSVHYVRGTGVRLEPPPAADVECFELTVTSVEVDSHDGMPVATPITFDTVRPSRAEVLDMWQAQLTAVAAATRLDTA
jgi:hypothetical protein